MEIEHTHIESESIEHARKEVSRYERKVIELATKLRTLHEVCLVAIYLWDIEKEVEQESGTEKRTRAKRDSIKKKDITEIKRLERWLRECSRVADDIVINL